MAHIIQCHIRSLSVIEYIYLVRKKEILDCPITIQDIMNAEFIWGPDLGSLKGKTMWKQPGDVRPHVQSIPVPIVQQYKNVTLLVDIIKVNNIPFFITISCYIKFGFTGKLDSMDNKEITKHFKQIVG